MSARMPPADEQSTADAGLRPFDFQRAETVARLEELIAAGSSGPKVVALRGAPGSGRAFLLEAVARRARERGERALCATLDLDGFEAGPGGLTAFAEHLLAGAEEGRRGAVVELARRLPSGAFGAACVALAAAGGAQPRADAQSGEQAWSGALADTAAAGALIVHVPRPAELPLVLWRALVRAARAETRLLAAASAEEDRPAELPFAPEAEVVDLRPLLPGEVVELLARNFPDAGLPRELGVALGRVTGGHAGRLAAYARRLLARGLPSAAGGPAEAAVVEAGELGADIEALLQGHADAPALRAFLALGALCGRNVPAKPLLELLGAPREAHERLLDFVDAHLLSDGLGVLADLEYRHPSFAPYRTPVYRFPSALERAVVLERFASALPPDTPRKLLALLGRSLPPLTRGSAALHAELAERAGDARRLEVLRRTLAWYAERDEAAALAQALGELADAGGLARAGLLDAAATAHGWPPYRRLAVLDAYAADPAGAAGPEAARFQLERALLLQADGRAQEALIAARAAAELAGERDPQRHAAALLVQARSLLLAGAHGEAIALARRASGALRGIEPPDRQGVAEALYLEAAGRARAGDPEGALPLLGEAEAELRGVLASVEKAGAGGAGHERLAVVLQASGACLVRLGRHAEAERRFAAALEEHKRGAEQGRLDALELSAALLALGQAQLAQGRPADARAPLQQAFAIARQGAALGRGPRELMGMILQTAGRAELRLKRPKDAAQLLAGAAAELSAPAQRARALARLALARARLGEEDSARTACEEARALRATLSAAAQASAGTATPP
jgi:hypothetical protein